MGHHLYHDSADPELQRAGLNNTGPNTRNENNHSREQTLAEITQKKQSAGTLDITHHRWPAPGPKTADPGSGRVEADVGPDP